MNGVPINQQLPSSVLIMGPPNAKKNLIITAELMASNEPTNGNGH
jgi:hypothetical protein